MATVFFSIKLIHKTCLIKYVVFLRGTYLISLLNKISGSKKIYLTFKKTRRLEALYEALNCFEVDTQFTTAYD